ncbi:DUF1648 domain-containing protein [Thermoanaerobacter sp. YS13]|uniref:DUF1648 domain-containing protein n=1 Tax=Thermoanaerobacter sp. YS13 TaxID=1511746 RepID=UPI0005B4E309|nr:DUF1648 domain-containing protein [Thermoanaerobacter sp. YS13]
MINRSYKAEGVEDLSHISSENVIKTERKYIIYLSLLIFAIFTIINLILYVKLPPQVYIHFGLTGNPEVANNTSETFLLLKQLQL